MRVILFFLFVFADFYLKAEDTLLIVLSDSSSTSKLLEINNCDVASLDDSSNIFENRLLFLNSNTPMDLVYNTKVQAFIDSYLGINKDLISRMKGLESLYFPLFEVYLDKYDLPLEFKYLAIVESALNPKAKSRSGAAGLWQFMYSTGKQYELNVTSYIDERQDPYKSTEAACIYFSKLYDMFGDWNLVLAAYNGGPGYIQRKISSVGSYDFWDLYPHLKKETRNYVPTFIAVNYAMNYAYEHGIPTFNPFITALELDTLRILQQFDSKILKEVLCVNLQTINYLNPSYKTDVFPSGSLLILPSYAVSDFLNNEAANYNFIDAVYSKDILIDEERVVYTVCKGDYLGKIASQHNVNVYELKLWNNLVSTDLNIGDKLVIYVSSPIIVRALVDNRKEYIVKKGDTLWSIAKQFRGLSVWRIKSLNNLAGDIIKPGTKIILPST